MEMKLKLCFLLWLCPFFWGYAQDNKLGVVSDLLHRTRLVCPMSFRNESGSWRFGSRSAQRVATLSLLF